MPLAEGATYLCTEQFISKAMHVFCTYSLCSVGFCFLTLCCCLKSSRLTVLGAGLLHLSAVCGGDRDTGAACQPAVPGERPASPSPGLPPRRLVAGPDHPRQPGQQDPERRWTRAEWNRARKAERYILCRGMGPCLPLTAFS